MKKVLLILTLAMGGLLLSSYTTNNQLLNTKVSYIDLPDQNGSLKSLNSLQGKYVLLHFWGSWCPCSVPHISNYRIINDKYKNARFKDADGFEVFSVGLEDSSQEWQKAIIEHQMNWPNNVIEKRKFDSPFAEAFQVDRIPAVFIIDPKGQIISINPSLKDMDKILSSVSDMPWPEYTSFEEELIAAQKTGESVPIFTGVKCKGKDCEPNKLSTAKTDKPVIESKPAKTKQPAIEKEVTASLTSPAATSSPTASKTNSYLSDKPSTTSSGGTLTSSSNDWVDISPNPYENMRGERPPSTKNQGKIITADDITSSRSNAKFLENYRPPTLKNSPTTTIKPYQNRNNTRPSTGKVKVGEFAGLTYSQLTRLSDLGELDIEGTSSGTVLVTISDFVNNFSSSDILAVVQSRGFDNASIIQ